MGYQQSVRTITRTFKMNRADRMLKSARARKRRKIVKEIRKTLRKRFYAHQRHLRQKYKKIRGRLHETETT